MLRHISETISSKYIVNRTIKNLRDTYRRKEKEIKDHSSRAAGCAAFDNIRKIKAWQYFDSLAFTEPMFIKDELQRDFLVEYRVNNCLRLRLQLFWRSWMSKRISSFSRYLLATFHISLSINFNSGDPLSLKRHLGQRRPMQLLAFVAFQN